MITIPLRALLQHRIGRPVDGVLGYDFLSRFVTEIDYAERRLRLHDPADFTYEGDGSPVPMEIMGSQPHIEASITLANRPPIEGLFMLDTGSGGALTLNGPFAEQNDLMSAMPMSCNSKVQAESADSRRGSSGVSTARQSAN